MPSRGPVDWSVEDVQEWLVNELQMPPAVAAAFKENAISGPDLLTLSDEDLTGELGCKTLQARKIRQALVKMGFHPPGSEGAAEAAAAAAAAPAAAPAPAPAAEQKPAAAAAPAPAPAPVAAAAVAPPPAGYPAPPPAAAYPPPPAPYGVPPAPVPYGAPPVYAYPPPEPAPAQKDNTGKAVAAAVLLTAPRRNFRRGFAMGRMT